ncbi:MAG: hypothetical protein VKJ27_02205 [Synechocystis sp.]|nr:hypothetical protein [Synechocystis sp.]
MVMLCRLSLLANLGLKVVLGPLLILVLAACSSTSPRCEAARTDNERQETLARMASPGGIDSEQLHRSRIERFFACGFSTSPMGGLNRTVSSSVDR